MRWIIALAGWATVALLAAGPLAAIQTNELHDALKLKPNYRNGEKLFQTCAACHGPDGSGVADGGIPNIAGQHYEVIIKQLADFRDNERWDPRMSAFTAKHHLRNAQSLADVADYISSLPPRRTQDLGSGEFLSAGQRIYANACAYCHGTDAAGNDQLRYPRLANQHSSYLLRQMRVMAQGGRSNVSWDHGKVLASLTDQELIGIADYLSRIQAPT